jgi:uncharacterized Tic20 family protein
MMNSQQPFFPGQLSPESERSYCILMHLLGLSGLILSITCIHLIAPLVLWLLKRSSSTLVDQTGKEVLNFQLSWTIYLLISGALCFVLIGWFIFPFLLLSWIFLIIRAAIKTSKGIFFYYPLTVRFIS